MALLAKNLSFLFSIILFISLHSQARESKFLVPSPSPSLSSAPPELVPSPSPSLSSAPPELVPSPSPSLSSIPPELAQEPSLAPELAPAPFEETEYGYGLYGQGSSNKIPIDTFTPESYKNTEENQIPTETKYFSPKTKENEIPFERLSSQSYSTDPYNSYSNNNYNGNGYMSNGYNVNGHVTEPQGMSDTRVLENGKYYYDTSYNEPVRRSGNNDEGYYRNNGDSKYEFDTMEEYEKQEGYPESQREYVP